MKERDFLPIVGPSLTYDAIFGDVEDLAESWSQELDVSSGEDDTLARVARYQHYRSGDEFRMKEGYLRFVKDMLLKHAQRAGADPDFVEEASNADRAFTWCAAQLGYPDFSSAASPNALSLLAELPLPVYLTTSCHGVLEEALRRVRREPRTAVYCWNDITATFLRPEHRFDPEHLPSVDVPLVFHLHGYDEYPDSLVLSEDDYLSFLESIAEGELQDNGDRSIPAVVRAALASATLLVLGFRPESLDFKVLWLALAPTVRRYGAVFQCDPQFKDEASRAYVEKYLQARQTEMYWGTADKLLTELHE